MNLDEEGGYAFVCPGCTEAIAVDESVRDELLERGCVICEATVTIAAFRPTPPIDAWKP